MSVTAVAALTLLAAACTNHSRTPVPTSPHDTAPSGYFRVPAGRRDGIRLPYRDWLPSGPVRHVVLALHGFDDSRDAWRTLGPVLARHGVAVFAPDQQGFGLSPGRGHWAGSETMVADARSIVTILRRRFPTVPLTVAGESMGGAVAILLAAQGDPHVFSYVLVSPAVWGGRAMAAPERWTVAALGALVPWLRLTGRQAGIEESDDRAALRRLSADPLTIHATRLGTVAGIVRMMGAAQAGCSKLHPAHALVMYGGNDQIISKRAMAACWRRIPADPGVVLAYYPRSYHLMLIDHQRNVPIDDIVSFVANPERPLPSQASGSARRFLARH
ncbi:MAG: alpha/beta hydrolase [Proteobacteria bacterium]|nr:alpha/beta hydrolase [Pseudomonadota bacterium]